MSDAAVLQPSAMVMVASAPPAASAASSAARARVTRSGEARDPEILRHRPKVWLSKTESGGASLSEQAAWRMRVARGRADELVYLVLGWHAGTPARRWRPNELVYVDDALAGISGDMLIRRVTSTLTEEGCVTELVVTGPEAFDRIDEGERRRRRRDRRKRGEASSGGNSVATTLREG